MATTHDYRRPAFQLSGSLAIAALFVLASLPASAQSYNLPPPMQAVPTSPQGQPQQQRATTYPTGIIPPQTAAQGGATMPGQTVAPIQQPTTTARPAAQGVNGQPVPIIQPGISPAGPSALPGIPTTPQTPINAPANIDLANLKIQQAAWNDDKPAPHQFAPGAARYNFRPGIMIHTRLGMPTTIEFPPNVVIARAIAGSSWLEERFVSNNSRMIYPSQPNKETSITLITNVGIFAFPVRTWSVETAPFKTDMQVTIDLPQSPAAQVATLASQIPALNSAGVMGDAASLTPPSELFSVIPDYAKELVLAKDKVAIPHRVEERTKGDFEAIGPVRVWEDGFRTYFEFGKEHRNRPKPIFSRMDNGVAMRVTDEKIDEENGIYAVHALGSFVLSYDQKMVCITRTDQADYGIRSLRTAAGS